MKKGAWLGKSSDVSMAECWLRSVDELHRLDPLSSAQGDCTKSVLFTVGVNNQGGTAMIRPCNM
jgi:hypothetical protein